MNIEKITPPHRKKGEVGEGEPSKFSLGSGNTNIY